MNGHSPLRTHLAWGWVTLAVSVFAGLALEVLHGLKLGFYLDADNETRRLLWRLAHAHGGLLGLLHLAFALTAPALAWRAGPARAGRLLKAATVLLPGGFLLGGAWTHGGDPGVGVALAPLGGLAFVAAVVTTAVAATRRAPAADPGQRSN